MAVTIVDINTTTFSIDGVEYLKNFQSVINGDTLKIFGVYDNDTVLVPLTIYSDFTVGGAGFASAILLQTALLNVLYNRNNISYEDGYQIINSVTNFNNLVTAGTSGVWLVLTDFTMSASKTLPAGVTLEFRDTQINLGGFTLTGTDTEIVNTESQIINLNGGALAGTWDVEKGNPVWLGAVGDGVVDNSIMFQSALDTFRNIRIPVGDWIVDNLNVAFGMSIIGDNYKTSALKTLAASTNPVFHMSADPVNNCLFSDFRIDGLETLGQDCFYLEGVPSLLAPFDGGMWTSTFERLTIRGFRGRSILLKGNETTFLEPNQFLSFRNVDIKRTDHSESICLLGIGQMGQVTFDNCQFDGQSITSAGYNIVLGKVYLNGGVYGGVTEGGVLQGDNTPSSISFINNCSVQDSVNGFKLEGTTNTSINTVWFENLHYAIETESSCINVVVDKSRFANAGDDGVGTGYCISNGGGCKLIAKYNYILGNADKWIQNTGHVRSYGNYSSTTSLISTGVIKNLSLSTNTLTGNFNKDIFLNTSTNDFQTFTSNVTVGDRVNIVVNGSNGYIKVTTAGNIETPLGHSIMFRHKDTFTLVRKDDNKYYLVNYSQERLQSAAIPAANYYVTGEFVWKTAPGIDGNQMVELGWSRLTTGTAHVSGTDWAICRCSTVSPAT